LQTEVNRSCRTGSSCVLCCSAASFFLNCGAMTAGRFPKDSILILITHGLALRIFLMRWFHWSVLQVSMSLLPRECMHATLTACPMPHCTHRLTSHDALLHSTELACVLATPLQMLEIYNPENCQPIVLDCMSSEADDSPNLQVLLSSWQMTAIAFQYSSCLGSSGPSMPGGSVINTSLNLLCRQRRFTTCQTSRAGSSRAAARRCAPAPGTVFTQTGTWSLAVAPESGGRSLVFLSANSP